MRPSKVHGDFQRLLPARMTVFQTNQLSTEHARKKEATKKIQSKNKTLPVLSGQQQIQGCNKTHIQQT